MHDHWMMIAAAGVGNIVYSLEGSGMDHTQHFKTVITSDHKKVDLHLTETLQYRDLIFLFVKRDFTAKYKQTVLGPA